MLAFFFNFRISNYFLFAFFFLIFYYWFDVWEVCWYGTEEVNKISDF